MAESLMSGENSLENDTDIDIEGSYQSSDDWEYRSRSSSAEDVQKNMLFTERQMSCDSESNSLDLSYLNMDADTCGLNISQFATPMTTINLSSNRLDAIPFQLLGFSSHLQMLDLSHNNIKTLCDSICQLTRLQTFICADNQLDENSLPKDFGQTFAYSLRVLSLGGNQFKSIPEQILELKSLKSLYLGSNGIEQVPRHIHRMESLRLLYLGGNQLEELPEEVGRLQHLESLSLCDNRLRSLPSTIAHLKSLRSLALHRNQLTTLPPEIVKLRGLIELSLRNNPLVMNFVRDMMYDVPSLMELAARTIKLNKINYKSIEMPKCLTNYLNSAHRCVNPKCKGVYFDSCVEHIRFVDFCGSYRLPLLQYLCSPRCSSQSPTISRTYSSDEESDNNQSISDEMITEFRLKRVLLG